jgi:23S rRNA pseudouridine955/2504/2580 synthase
MRSENKKRIISSIIEKKYAGYRIDNFLSEKFDYHSRNTWQNIILNEIITLNNKSCKCSKNLKAGDVVRFIIEDFEEPECNLNYEIAYEDEHILAVNKPHNCIIHPVGPFFKNTLTYKLEEDLNYPVYSINRLDRETTGIVLLGKDPKTAKLLSQYFIDRKIYKEYIVAVHGLFPDKISTEGYLLRDNQSTVRKKRKFQYNPPEDMPESEFETSKTDFEFIKNAKINTVPILNDNQNSKIKNNEIGQIIPGSKLLPDAREKNKTYTPTKTKSYDNNISLVKVILKTGRQHQIRATLCSLGYPVIGDKLYGVDDTIYLRFIERKLLDADIQNLRIKHQALHAGKLSFIHPYTNKEIKIQVPPPQEITMFFN